MVLFLMTSLNGKLILAVLLTLLLKMCICSLASDTFVIVKLVIPFFTRTLCLELIMSLMYGMAAVMCISKSLSLYTNVQSKIFVLLRQF